ncbi:MAG: DUF1566 domain-containing protein [Epsilonproteobacteria bacterium]|nr:DUF1566 domain-containing protein [Campylobacterota bacterium]
MKNASLLLLAAGLFLGAAEFQELPQKYEFSHAKSACKNLGAEWRVPEIWELFALKGETQKYGSDKRYWSATELLEERELNIHTSSDESYIKKGEAKAFAFYLQDGDITPTPLFVKAHLLCTDTPKIEQSYSHLQQTKDGVKDTLNNLLWASLPKGNERLSYEKANMACETSDYLGRSWRLPTLDELYSIVDYTKVKPSVDSELFERMASRYYWTQSEFSRSDAYVVGFSIGSVATVSKESETFYRCVSEIE